MAFTKTAGVVYGTPGLTLTTANAAGSTQQAVRIDADLLVYDVTVPTDITAGDAAATGSAVTSARRDHVHGAEDEYTTFEAPNFPLGTSNVLGSGDSVHSGATLLAFDAVNPDSITFGQSASPGAATVASRRDHEHGMVAEPATYNLVESYQDFVEGGATQVVYFTNGALSNNQGTTGTLIGGGWTFITNGGYQLNQSTVIRGAMSIRGDGVAGKYSTIIGGQDLSAADDWTLVTRAVISNTTASIQAFLGLSTSDSPADANDRIGFKSLAGNIFGFTDSGGTESTVDTGVAADGTTVHTFRMVVSGDGGTVTFYMDNVLVDAPITTNIPTSTAMQFTIGATGTTGVEGFIDLANAFAWREV